MNIYLTYQKDRLICFANDSIWCISIHKYQENLINWCDTDKKILLDLAISRHYSIHALQKYIRLVAWQMKIQCTVWQFPPLGSWFLTSPQYITVMHTANATFWLHNVYSVTSSLIRNIFHSTVMYKLHSANAEISNILSGIQQSLRTLIFTRSLTQTENLVDTLRKRTNYEWCMRHKKITRYHKQMINLGVHDGPVDTWSKSVLRYWE